MILAALGRLMRAAIDRVTPRARATTFAPGELHDLMTRAYLEGARAGRVYHTFQHGLPAAFPRSELNLAIEAALAHADEFTTRLHTAATRQRVSAALAINITTVASTLAIWAGQDDQADRVATEAETRWKRWVRVFPRTHHRDHHDALEGLTIPEDALFRLPGGTNAGARVSGPRDFTRVADAGEWANCGHALQHLRQVTRDQLNN